MLYSSNNTGSTSNIKLETYGDIVPGDSAYTAPTLWDRDHFDWAVSSHNSSTLGGHGQLVDVNPWGQCSPATVSAAGSTGYKTPSAFDATPLGCEAATLYLFYRRTDGLVAGGDSTVQGRRTFNQDCAGTADRIERALHEIVLELDFAGAQ
jgi:hypothetical protein